jgi:hypothetical protein
MTNLVAAVQKKLSMKNVSQSRRPADTAMPASSCHRCFCCSVSHARQDTAPGHELLNTATWDDVHLIGRARWVTTPANVRRLLLVVDMSRSSCSPERMRTRPPDPHVRDTSLEEFATDLTVPGRRRPRGAISQGPLPARTGTRQGDRVLDGVSPRSATGLSHSRGAAFPRTGTRTCWIGPPLCESYSAQ